jgi:hypothetical protein
MAADLLKDFSIMESLKFIDANTQKQTDEVAVKQRRRLEKKNRFCTAGSMVVAARNDEHNELANQRVKVKTARAANTSVKPHIRSAHTLRNRAKVRFQSITWETRM